MIPWHRGTGPWYGFCSSPRWGICVRNISDSLSCSRSSCFGWVAGGEAWPTRPSSSSGRLGKRDLQPVPVVVLLGELQRAIWKKQFEALRDGDRFFYLNDPFLITIKQLYGIDYQHTLGELIRLNTGAELQPDVFQAPH